MENFLGSFPQTNYREQVYVLENKSENLKTFNDALRSISVRNHFIFMLKEINSLYYN